MKLKLYDNYADLLEWGDFWAEEEIEYDENSNIVTAVGEWVFRGVHLYPVELRAWVKIKREEEIDGDTVWNAEWREFQLDTTLAEVIAIDEGWDIEENRKEYEWANIWELIEEYLEG